MPLPSSLGNRARLHLKKKKKKKKEKKRKKKRKKKTLLNEMEKVPFGTKHLVIGNWDGNLFYGS